MTYEEAHSYLEDLQRKYTRDRYLYKPEFIEANGLAILALEKQIPKKPKGDYDSVPHHRCPNCNGAIRVYCDDPYDPVCKFCGQVIDWSDEE